MLIFILLFTGLVPFIVVSFEVHCYWSLIIMCSEIGDVTIMFLEVFNLNLFLSLVSMLCKQSTMFF